MDAPGVAQFLVAATASEVIFQTDPTRPEPESRAASTIHRSVDHGDRHAARPNR
jgi:hypothetical protein